MSTLVWPAPADTSLDAAIESTQRRELEWLLTSLQETLRSLKAGLEETAALLAPTEPGVTLVVSSLRSEALKGFVTRVGTRIVKGDITLRLPSLVPPRGQQAVRASVSQQPAATPIVLEQLATTRTLINSCLDVVDATQWTGDSTNANFISGQLRLLHENVQEARNALRGWNDKQKSWPQDSYDFNVFESGLPKNVSFHFFISEAALILIVRTIELADPNEAANASFTGFSLRERFTTALGGPRTVSHDEMTETFSYRGQEVRVKDKVRIDSQDPNLMAALAKLGALERSVTISRKALDVVMGREYDDLTSNS
ncbi:hypothetical protein AMS68_004725 [Peltaster fructicola]|uniref:RAVE subunit 2/Rogdi n=1 Tax=Peltaster fructicola TaxID=286661 RepID=A0A6H0XX90_9PEZI|nr:hypothetical protein AMS68_004725 [Peltaster fructicola]